MINTSVRGHIVPILLLLVAALATAQANMPQKPEQNLSKAEREHSRKGN